SGIEQFAIAVGVVRDPRAPRESTRPAPKPRVRKNAVPVSEVEHVPEEEPEPELSPDVRVVVRRPSASSRTKLKELRARDEIPAPVAESFPDYKFPKVDLLAKGEASVGGENDDELREKSLQIESKLRDFGISGKVTHVHPGPVIT